jgi:hypothetical protein
VLAADCWRITGNSEVIRFGQFDSCKKRFCYKLLQMRRHALVVDRVLGSGSQQVCNMHECVGLPNCQTVVFLTKLDSIPAIADMLLVIVYQQKLVRSRL